MESKNISVKLMGQEITLKTKGDPEFIEEVVELVNRKLENAELRVKGGVSHHVALLAAFDLAEEYLKAKNRVQKNRQVIREKSERLIELVAQEARH